jgi:hypothetical protein
MHNQRFKLKPVKITDITRQALIDRISLVTKRPPWGDDLIGFLRRIFPLNQMPSTDGRFKNAEGDIWQHMVNNNDWDESYLLWQRLKLGEIPDELFCLFLETRVHPRICPDEREAAALVVEFNDELKNDGFKMIKASEISGRPIYKVVQLSGGAVGTSYEVVLSFAGEDRGYVLKVAEILKQNDVGLFYDNYEEVELWGKNLVEHLHKVYSSLGRFCVMFISNHYAEKVWPSHERRSAFEKAIESKEEYILPARFDDTEIPGLHKHIGYVDLRKKTPEELAAMILKKLGRVPEPEPEDAHEELSDDDIPF